MKQISAITIFIFLIAQTFLYAHQPYEGVGIISLTEAIKKKWVKLEQIQRSRDGNLELKVRNLTKNENLSIRVACGARFKSVDPGEQDQITVKDAILVFKEGNREAIVLVRSYCTQASNSSPNIGSPFEYAGQATGELLKIAAFFKEKGSVPRLTQQAIWVFTDNRSLDGLYHQNPTIQKKTQDFVSKLSGRPMPRYVKEYSRLRAGQRAADLVMRRLKGIHKIKAPKDGLYSCFIYKPDGTVLKRVFKPRYLMSGTEMKAQFRIESSEIEQGFYRSKLMVDDEVIDEIIIRC